MLFGADAALKCDCRLENCQSIERYGGSSEYYCTSLECIIAMEGMRASVGVLQLVEKYKKLKESLAAVTRHVGTIAGRQRREG